MGRLEITLVGARNIGDTQKVGMPDPYVKVRVGDDKKNEVKFKAPVVDNNVNPTWNQQFKFLIADSDRMQVAFELWNSNVFVDDLLGSYRLSLNGLKKGVVEDMWVILAGTKLTSAELHLRALAVDFGLPPAAGDKIVRSIEQYASEMGLDSKPAVPQSTPAPALTSTFSQQGTQSQSQAAQAQRQQQVAQLPPQQQQPQVVYSGAAQPQIVYVQAPSQQQPVVYMQGPPPQQPAYYPPQQPAYYPPQQPAYYPPQQPAYYPPQQPAYYPAQPPPGAYYPPAM